jgi:hypothetical protein
VSALSTAYIPTSFAFSAQAGTALEMLQLHRPSKISDDGQHFQFGHTALFVHYYLSLTGFYHSHAEFFIH